MGLDLHRTKKIRSGIIVSAVAGVVLTAIMVTSVDLVSLYEHFKMFRDQLFQLMMISIETTVTLLILITVALIWVLRGITRKILPNAHELQQEIDQKTMALKQANEMLDHIATHDTLTQLSNRRLFEHTMNKEIQRCLRYGHHFTLLFMDINHFKSINDVYGHAGGDVILREVSKRLSEKLRRSDHIARWGGDEFAVILTETHEKPKIDSVLEKLRLLFEEPISIDHEKITVTMAIGIVRFPENGKEAHELLKLADRAMYQAKKAEQFYHYATS